MTYNVHECFNLFLPDGEVLGDEIEFPLVAEHIESGRPVGFYKTWADAFVSLGPKGLIPLCRVGSTAERNRRVFDRRHEIWGMLS